MCFHTEEKNTSNAVPLFATVEQQYLDKLHEYKTMVESIGSDAVQGIEMAVTNARKKHPTFSFRFMDSESDRVEAICKCLKANNDQEGRIPSAVDILMEEIYEVMEAFGKGQLNQCISEIDDSIAVLIRMRKFVDVIGNSIKTMGM